ncbi:MAG TPA: 16S rRNA (cytosine(1402)-N(4))-methyltransferase RsmH [Stellaceae bacterium]|jgi:16S rRNA (cytosine1402-N4)-methyltransferase|nr:16S rRNA (cytosine(1402)-N(4))-methyltransferase RsmH [Stellaceae bacterium]
MTPQPAESVHRPVMLAEVLSALAPRDGATYVDGTFGGGGYSTALLAAARCRVFGIDRDPDAVRRGQSLAAEHDGRLTLIEGRFGDMERLVAPFAPGLIAGVALDLGVSSDQIDEPERGFSFRYDGPLDMRMGRDGQSAADLVAELSEEELAELIRELGEERFARRVARAIATARAKQPIDRTGELAEIVRAAIPRREPGLDSATRTFQALRIAVNDELGELDRGLEAAERLLMPGGRVAVVAFHSLEDGRVKNFLRRRSGTAPAGSRHAPPRASGPAPSFALLSRRPVKPSAAETSANPRARSARLRAAERTAAPAIGLAS